MLVLVVEDDDAIAEPLLDGLRRSGFEADRVRTGRDALEHAGADVVLLDLGLPDLDGVEVCRRLRAERDVPVIVVSARSEELDRVLLLEMGADDYVVKPFGLRELVARIRAVSRRSLAAQPGSAGERDATVRTVGALTVDTRTRGVAIGGREVELTPKEFDLLALLAEDPGAVRTRQEILETVWDPHWYGPTKTLDVHMASLRRKLGDATWITTVRGVGFRLEPPAAGDEEADEDAATEGSA